MAKWLPMREVLISRLNGRTSIIPVDLDGVTHISTQEQDHFDVVLVYYGATTARLEEGNICIRGNRLYLEVESRVGRQVCLIVKVIDTSGEET